MNEEWYRFIENGLLKALDSRKEFLVMSDQGIKDGEYDKAILLLTSPLFDENADQDVKEKWSTQAARLCNHLIDQRDYDAAELIADKFLSIDPYSFDAVELKEKLSDRDQLILESNLSKVKKIASSFIRKYYPEESSLFNAIWSTILSLKPDRLKLSPQLLNQLAMVDGEELELLSTKSYTVAYLMSSSFFGATSIKGTEDLKASMPEILKRAMKNNCDKDIIINLNEFIEGI